MAEQLCLPSTPLPSMEPASSSGSINLSGIPESLKSMDGVVSQDLNAQGQINLDLEFADFDSLLPDLESEINALLEAEVGTGNTQLMDDFLDAFEGNSNTTATVDLVSFNSDISSPSVPPSLPAEPVTPKCFLQTNFPPPLTPYSPTPFNSTPSPHSSHSVKALSPLHQVFYPLPPTPQQPLFPRGPSTRKPIPISSNLAFFYRQIVTNHNIINRLMTLLSRSKLTSPVYNEDVATIRRVLEVFWRFPCAFIQMNTEINTLMNASAGALGMVIPRDPAMDHLTDEMTKHMKWLWEVGKDLDKALAAHRKAITNLHQQQ